MDSLTVRFDRLEAIDPSPDYTDANPLWDFRCSCGSEFRASYANIKTRHFNGEYVSCGCVRPQPNKHYRNSPHAPGTKHPIYVAWNHARTGDPKFLRAWDDAVGGYLPTLCDEWLIYPVFFDAVSPSWRQGLVLDRERLHEDFGPTNFVWVTPEDYAQRRELTDKVLDSPLGKMTPAEFCKVYGFEPYFLRTALAQGHTSLALSAERRAYANDLLFIATPDGPMTINAAAKVSGLSVATLLHRVQAKWDATDIFAPPSPANRYAPNTKKRVYTHQNATNTLIPTPEGFITATEAANISGLPRVTLLQRAKRKWPLEYIFAPIGTRLPKHLKS